MDTEGANKEVEHIRYSFQKLLDLLEQRGFALCKVGPMPPMRPFMVAVRADWADIVSGVGAASLFVDRAEVVNLRCVVPAYPTLSAPPLPRIVHVFCRDDSVCSAPLGLQVRMVRPVVMRLAFSPLC